MLVDFHVHSTASDGTLFPVQIAQEAANRKFAAVALTDHDNCDGVHEFLKGGTLLPVAGRRRHRIAGVELSIEAGVGFDKFHLLGLGIDPESESLRKLLKRILEGREARNMRIIENFLQKAGIDISGVCYYPHGEIMARPHFARWLVDHGYSTDMKEAFAKYLLPDSPVATRCYEERWHPPQEEAFRAIHEAGGICVMAHPKYWRNDWKTTGPDYAAAERELAALKERGLDGVEALYQANTNEENIAFTRIATKLGYLRTAGSDFHGANKPTIPLGMEVSEEFIVPVLERLDMV